MDPVRHHRRKLPPVPLLRLGLALCGAVVLWLPALVWAWGRLWIDRRQRRPLDQRQRELARRVGIRRLDRLRLCPMPGRLFPLPSVLARALQRGGIPAGSAIGLALGHVIYLRDLPPGGELLRHELVHVRQVERCRGLPWFLLVYLWQCLAHGYEAAPMEREARGEPGPWDAATGPTAAAGR